MTTLTDKQIETIKSRFNDHDVDGNGFVTREEFQTILGDYYPDDYISKLLKDTDANNDGQVSYEEFLASHGS